jgi:hypothetical protein
MGTNVLTQSPFAVLTFIVAPAILTNATSVLAMSTINRMLRTRDRMHELYAESKSTGHESTAGFMEQVDRVERQGVLLLRALRWIYVSLGAFAAASLVTLLGALAGQVSGDWITQVVIGAGLVLGFGGVTGLVFGSFNLFRATQLSLVNMRVEAAAIRLRHRPPGG